jgi:hypothetical protein
MAQEQKKQHGGKREGAGRKPKAEGEGKSLYFRFRCTQKVYNIIHLHEDEGMSDWIERAILEKYRREERY